MNNQQGFSLIEVAIALVITGLLLGGLMTPLATQMDSSRRNETRQTQAAVLEAIYGYALVTGNLPCPDTDNDGLENRAGNACVAPGGTLPWATLAIGNGDGWGRNFIYRVSANFADTNDGTGCDTPTPGVSFSLCSTGDIQVQDAAAGGMVANGVPAIVVSQGNSLGVAADETENSDNDSVFVARTYTADYDDMVVWLVPGILYN